MRAFASDLRVGSPTASVEHLARAIYSRLSELRCSYLVVFDNVDDFAKVAPLLPPPCPPAHAAAAADAAAAANPGKRAPYRHAIITTRSQHPAGWPSPLTVAPFTQDEAFALYVTVCWWQLGATL
jgi:hypothetical protein